MDREKVMEGLRHCADRTMEICNQTCPYYRMASCETELAADALVMLREQQRHGIIEEDTICYIRQTEIISRKKVNIIFGSLIDKKNKITEFMHKMKEETPIQVDELNKHSVALFQNWNEWNDYSLVNIMVDFDVDMERGEVTGRKLFYYNRHHELETRVYKIKNYGTTWRAWAALPTREAARRWEIDIRRR